MNTPTTPTASQANPMFRVKGQYIKDLSFENPHAPQSLTAINQKPVIDVNVDLRGEKVQEGVYEMTIHIAVRATVDSGVLFLVELAYAGLFELTNIPPEHLEQLLWIECPFVLFPFARRVVADATRDGGFPPLMLDPIDFHALYMQNCERIQAEKTTS